MDQTRCNLPASQACAVPSESARLPLSDEFPRSPSRNASRMTPDRKLDRAVCRLYRRPKLILPDGTISSPDSDYTLKHAWNIRAQTCVVANKQLSSRMMRSYRFDGFGCCAFELGAYSPVAIAWHLNANLNLVPHSTSPPHPSRSTNRYSLPAHCRLTHLKY